MSNWTWLPPARSGDQIEGTNVLPFGLYRLPSGELQTSFGLPAPLLDAVRAMKYATGRGQDPNAPEGFVSKGALNRGGAGLAGSAATGGSVFKAPSGAVRSFGRKDKSFAKRSQKISKTMSLYRGEPKDAQGGRGEFFSKSIEHAKGFAGADGNVYRVDVPLHKMGELRTAPDGMSYRVPKEMRENLIPIDTLKYDQYRQLSRHINVLRKKRLQEERSDKDDIILVKQIREMGRTLKSLAKELGIDQ